MFSQQVLNENSSFRSAAEEFSLKKSTLVDAVKRYKSRMQDLEKGSPSANNDNDSVRESCKFVFTPKQERNLAIYLENCSILKHGLNPNATRKLA